MAEGLIEKGRRYFNVQNGLMTERVNGQDRAINYISHVHLVKAEFKNIFKGPESSREYVGEQLHLHFISETEYYVLCMWANSKYAKSFYAMMESINLHKDMVMLAELRYGDDGKKRENLYIKQNGSFLKWNYTRNNQNGCPALIPLPNGRYDDAEQMAFFKEKVNNWLSPRLERVLNPFPYHPSYGGNTGKKLAGDYFDQYADKGHISHHGGNNEAVAEERRNAEEDRMREQADGSDDLPF